MLYTIHPMKAGIHPKYFEATVTCACGNTFKVQSAKPQLFAEVCFKCHPLFTGEERMLDMKGQVEKFKAKQDFAKAYAARKKDAAPRNKKSTGSKSLKDLLANA